MCVYVCKCRSSNPQKLVSSKLFYYSPQTSTQTPSTYLLVSPKSKHALQSITAQYPESLTQSLQSDKKKKDFPGWWWLVPFCSYNPTLKMYHSAWCKQILAASVRVFTPPNHQGKASMARLVTNSQEWSLRIWCLDPQNMSRSQKAGSGWVSLWVG